MLEIVIKHCISLTKDFVFSDKISETYKIANTVTLISVICSWMSKIMQENGNWQLISHFLKGRNHNGLCSTPSPQFLKL